MLAKNIDMGNAIERYIIDYIGESATPDIGGGFGGGGGRSIPAINTNTIINKPNTVTKEAHHWIEFAHAHMFGQVDLELLKAISCERSKLKENQLIPPAIESLLLLSVGIYVKNYAVNKGFFERALAVFDDDQPRFDHFMFLLVASKRANRSISKYEIAELCGVDRAEIRGGRKLGMILSIFSEEIQDYEQQPYNHYFG